jgi:hypothetical protein
MKITLAQWSELLRAAIAKRELRTIGRLVEAGRMAGLNYNQQAKQSGLSVGDWESLMQDVDEAEAEESEA